MIQAAIDIGSNAVRLLIGEVISMDNQEKYVNKHALIRLPIRLGEDVFSTGRIGVHAQANLLKGIQSLKNISEIYQAKKFICTATSAMREAENKEEVIELIKLRTGVEVMLIEGKNEANIILNGINKALPPEVKEFVHVDVGGGSTEINYMNNGELLASKSFKIGSVRHLNGKVAAEEWDSLKTFLKEIKSDSLKIGAGSGGNINKLFKLLPQKNGKKITTSDLQTFHKHLKELHLSERVKLYGLKPDRADVIVPAGEIYLKIYQKLGIEEIYVPKVGLADGIILGQLD